MERWRAALGNAAASNGPRRRIRSRSRRKRRRRGRRRIQKDRKSKGTSEES